MKKKIDCIVAGHTCMDLFPAFLAGADSIEEIIQPGKLVELGPLDQAMAGAVPNTAGALHRLGLSVFPMGKTGHDILGNSILAKMESAGLSTRGMIKEDSCGTSYTLVLNIPGLDRIPLHYPGTNDTFCTDDLDFECIQQGRHFHFGYPPLMREMYADEGGQLSEIFARVKKLGLGTSLDMARPDPQSEAGKANWTAIMQKVLPFVDLFTPSIDELLYMMDPALFNTFISSEKALGGLSRENLQELGKRLLNLGAGAVLLKLGDCGAFYMSEHESHYSPCFKVELKGAIGSGDCTIAGFLAAQLKGLQAHEALTVAVAAGACNVEAVDSLSGIPEWEKLQERISNGWEKHPSLFTH